MEWHTAQMECDSWGWLDICMPGIASLQMDHSAHSAYTEHRWSASRAHSAALLLTHTFWTLPASFNKNTLYPTTVLPHHHPGKWRGGPTSERAGLAWRTNSPGRWEPAQKGKKTDNTHDENNMTHKPISKHQHRTEKFYHRTLEMSSVIRLLSNCEIFCYFC